MPDSTISITASCLPRNDLQPHYTKIKNKNDPLTYAAIRKSLHIPCILSFGGAVHAWCARTSAWVLAQNTVMFSPWVLQGCH